ncbi:hypothetical protein AB1K62_06050 [Parasphingorhabdus sp. JC815]|uniref:hypothetical protein n=1 Tax=Parasphingorhabdus sp. JC815 TaxID=3232140 RepID=UPI003459C033
MTVIHVIIAMAMALAPASETPEAPTDYQALETAKFSRPISYSSQHERAAERTAKKAACDLPVVDRWVFAKIHAALLIAPDGEILRIVPVESRCRELEIFMANHLAKYGPKAGPQSSGTEPLWYKTTMNFRWPE